MSRPSKPTLWAFVLATVAGACLHFLYEFLPNPLTACLSPVNESLWEHLKLLYWPSAAAFLLLARREGRQSLGPRALALLLGCGVMLAAGYVCYILLDAGNMAFDIVLYVLLMAGIFLLPPLLPRTWCAKQWELPVLLAAALGGALLLFTFLPPRGALFADLSLTSQYTFFSGM